MMLTTGGAFEYMQDIRDHDCSDSALGRPRNFVRRRLGSPTPWPTLEHPLLVHSFGANHPSPSSPGIYIVRGVLQRFVVILCLSYYLCIYNYICPVWFLGQGKSLVALSGKTC